MTTFKGYSIGLGLPYKVQMATIRLRASIDSALKYETPFDANQTPHITVVRDIDAQAVDEASKIVLAALPLNITMAEMHTFTMPDYDVLVKKSDTPTIKKLNTELCTQFALSFPYDFSAHITVAFLKANTRPNLVDIEKSIRIPQQFTVDTVLIFNPKGIVTNIIRSENSEPF